MNTSSYSGATQQHLFSMAPLGVWLRMVVDNGGVSPKYWGKLAKVVAISAMFTPLRIAERLFYSRSRMATVPIDEAPLYIQGFGRSGTTHLLNLLAQDPQFGVVSTFQAMAAPMFLISRGWLERLISSRIPATRPMDNMTVSLDLPQEDDVALANSSRHSPAHVLTFPRRAPELLGKYATMQLTNAEMAEWERIYVDILHRAAFAAEGRRLLLKSPANLGRTAVLRQLFPEAKFVHIVRNPYVVYQSMAHMYQTLLPICQMEDAAPDVIAAATRRSYVLMMKRYLADRVLIPKGHLTEIRYEDLELNPLGELERVYSELTLPGWDLAQTKIRDYVRKIAGYRKNTYEIDSKSVEVVNREWGFAVKEWGYEPPTVVQN